MRVHRKHLKTGDRVQFTRYYYLREARHRDPEEVLSVVSAFVRYDGDKHAWVQMLDMCSEPIRVRVVSIEPLGAPR